MTQLLKRSTDPATRGQAATLLVRAYLALDQVENLIQILPQLLEVSESRHDVDFNLLLVQAGDDKFHAGDFANALLLYQLALSKEEILDWHNRQIASLQETLRLLRNTPDVKQATAVRTRLRRLEKTEGDRRDSFTAELLSRRGQAFFELNRNGSLLDLLVHLEDPAEERHDPAGAIGLRCGELNMDRRPGIGPGLCGFLRAVSSTSDAATGQPPAPARIFASYLSPSGRP